MTRHSINPEDTDGGTVTAAIEKEAESLGSIGGRLSAFARSLGARPGWTDSPAVQAWHRNDGHTEHDGAPVKPRIWSPDYRTTERWSTPSLRNVHWSDLVDVTPLHAPENDTQACPDPDAHWRLDEALERAEKAEGERDTYKKLHRGSLRALEEVEQERENAEVCVRGDWFKSSELPEVLGRVMDSRDEAQREAKRHYLRAEQPRTLTADDVTTEMVERAQTRILRRATFITAETIRLALGDALTEPTRPDWEQESAKALTAAVWGMHIPNEAGEAGDKLAASLARHGYKIVPVVNEEQS